MSARRSAVLQEMGLGPRWVLRAAPVRSPGSPGTDRSDPAMPELAVGDMDWPQLHDAVAGCRRCDACAGRSQAVFGEGGERAGWLFVGAWPDAQDEAGGMPLTGAGGHLFAAMLRAIGLQRDDKVFVTNLLKCRPATAREASGLQDWHAELAACRPYLERQIGLLGPSVIVALGAEVGAALLGTNLADAPGLRGSVRAHGGVPLVVTHAPRELLRLPAAKAEAWRDLCLARDAHAARQ